MAEKSKKTQTTTKSKTETNKKTNNSNVKTKPRNLGLVVAVWVLSGVLLASLIFNAISLQNVTNMALSLEDIYQKNFYDLVDNINNTETKLAKTLSSTDEDYQAKMLEQISKNASMAQENLNNLPYSINGLDESISFVNQVAGYTEVLSKNLMKGETITSSQHKELENIYDSVLDMKDSLNQMSKDMWNGYSILKSSNSLNGDYNNFTNDMKSIKPEGVEYPVLIYDGPFSDSQVKKEIKGLKGASVDAGTAKVRLLEILSDYTDEMVKLENETNGNFDTYNFNIQAKENNKDVIAFVQMTKVGANLLTLSAYNANKDENESYENFKSRNLGSNKLNKQNAKQNKQNSEEITQSEIVKNQGNNKDVKENNISQNNSYKSQKLSLKNAEAIALDFAKKNKLENMKVVWSDTVSGNAFINMAPVQNGIILYPDLVKVKIDLYNGLVLGYEATSYYTNHTNRNLEKGSVSVDTARNKIGDKYVISQERMALIPLDYGREVLCHEFVCKYGGDDYYFYINTSTGKEENILKVIQTDNGNLLM